MSRMFFKNFISAPIGWLYYFSEMIEFDKIEYFKTRIYCSS